MQNSWYLKEDGQHHFICKCGEHEVFNDDSSKCNSDMEVVKFNREEVDFSAYYYRDNSCKNCNNDKYLDLKALLYEDKTRYWSHVYLEYEEKLTTNGWEIEAFITIPKVDIQTKRVSKETMQIVNYQINNDGDDKFTKKNDVFLRKSMMVDEKYLRFERILENEIDTKMSQFILKNPSKNIEWLKEEKLPLKGLLFFLKNPYIRSKDIYYWHNKEYFLESMNQYQYLDKILIYILNFRNEKSIRKSLFNTYIQTMKLENYNPMSDYIFARTIHDVNHLNRALNIDIEVKNQLFNACSVENIIYFIDFLKNFYSEKHIVQLWSTVSLDDLAHFLVRDTTELFSNKEMRKELKENFQKTSLNIIAIHYELTKHSRRIEKLKMKNENFSYNDIMIASEVSMEDITYKLPIDMQELYDWGSILHNCIFSYKNYILNGKSTIFGLFINNHLTYALEIHNDKIVQISARYNKALSPSEQKKVDRWYKKVYMKNLMKLFR